MKAFVRVNKKDSVVTCIRALAKGEKIEVDGREITVNADIPIFHKVAITSVPKGGLCYKYGEIIGRATADIRPGDYVHVHNLESTRGRGDQMKQTAGR
mgnify:CR=1 FL=1